MPFIIPLQVVPSQSLQCSLSNQACILNVYQQAYGLYMDVLIGTIPIVQGILCQNGNLIIRNTYLGFIGDFIFLDKQQQNNDPVYTGFGSRYVLVYMTAADLAALKLPVGVA